MLNHKNQEQLFYRLSQLLESGIPLHNALMLLTLDHSSQKWQQEINTISDEILKGETLSMALKKTATEYPHIVIALIEVGEKTGALEETLKSIIHYYQKKSELKQKTIKALFYPLLVLLMTVIITIFLLLFVVPQFQSLFQEFNATLPFLTQLILKTTHFLEKHLINSLLLISSLIMAVFYSTRNYPLIKNLLEKLIFLLPFVGKNKKISLFSLLNYHLSLCLKSGLPLAESLEILMPLMPQSAFQQALSSMHDEISQGESFTKSLKKTHLFPDFMTQIVAIGEEAGKLDGALMQVSLHYEERLQDRLALFYQWLEPLLMVLLSIIVGTIIIGIYLPIFELGMVF